MKLLLSGHSIAELREEALKFIMDTNEKHNVVTVQEGIAKSTELPLPIPFAPPPIPTDSDEEDADMDDSSLAIPSMVGQVDKRGFPWDERIHAVTRGINKNGTWRYRRGVEDKDIFAIEQQMLATIKGQPVTPVVLPEIPVAPVPVEIPAPTPVPALAMVPPLPTVAPVVVAPAPAMPSIPVQQPVTFTHSLETFKTQLIPTLGKLVENGKLTQGYIESLKSYFQVDQIWKVNDLQVAEMFETFAANGLIQKVV